MLVQLAYASIKFEENKNTFTYKNILNIKQQMSKALYYQKTGCFI